MPPKRPTGLALGSLLYTGWCVFWLVGLFLLLFPWVFLCLQNKKGKPIAHRLNRLWGLLFFRLVGMPVVVKYAYRPRPEGTYVFCPNHFSYLDIAVMGVVLDHYFAFVGKHSVKQIPLFGYMFAKLHIQVNREKGESRAFSLAKSLRTLAAGRSIVIFPEGGILSKNPPQLHGTLQKGAFLMAIQQQVPLVPISLLTNHERLPDITPLRLRPGRIEAIVHEPIPTAGLGSEHLPELMEQWRSVVQGALFAHQKGLPNR